MKEKTKECVTIRHRRISPAKSFFLILAGTVSVALLYATTVPGVRADAGYFSSFMTSSRDDNFAKRQAVLDWMGRNSAMPDRVLAKIYNAAAGTHNIDLVLAICLVESNFNPYAESEKGAIGLMGIMPDVWVDELKEQGLIREKKDLYKISGNIAAGAYVIAKYMSKTGDLSQALNRYVGGASWYAARVLEAKRKIEMVRGLQASNSPLQRPVIEGLYVNQEGG